MTERTSILDQRFLTVPELATLLKVSVGTIYRRLEEWPHTRITDTDVRFTEKNVEDIIALRTKTPVPPRPSRMGRQSKIRREQSGYR